jgi:hypothetical protein
VQHPNNGPLHPFHLPSSFQKTDSQRFDVNINTHIVFVKIIQHERYGEWTIDKELSRRQSILPRLSGKLAYKDLMGFHLTENGYKPIRIGFVCNSVVLIASCWTQVLPRLVE